MDRTSVTGHNPGSSSNHSPTPSRSGGASDTRNYDDVPRISGGETTHSQRESPRGAPPCSALVKTGAGYVIARAIHDISLAGLYVELDPAGVVLGDLVEVALEFNDTRGIIDLQLTAEVARVERNGVGLRFCDYSDETYTDLVNLIYAR